MLQPCCQGQATEPPPATAAIQATAPCGMQGGLARAQAGHGFSDYLPSVLRAPAHSPSGAGVVSGDHTELAGAAVVPSVSEAS